MCSGTSSYKLNWFCESVPKLNRSVNHGNIFHRNERTCNESIRAIKFSSADFIFVLARIFYFFPRSFSMSGKLLNNFPGFPRPVATLSDPSVYVCFFSNSLLDFGIQFREARPFVFRKNHEVGCRIVIDSHQISLNNFFSFLIASLKLSAVNAFSCLSSDGEQIPFSEESCFRHF